MVDSLRLAIGLWVIGGGEGNIVFEEASEGRGKLGTSVSDNLVMEAESWEDVLEKDLSDVCSRGGFVARAENYSL